MTALIVLVQRLKPFYVHTNQENRSHEFTTRCIVWFRYYYDHMSNFIYQNKLTVGAAVR